MTCEPKKGEDAVVAVFSPESPQTTVNTGELQLTFDLSVVAPTRHRLERLQGPYGDAIVIERETGQVSWGLFNPVKVSNTILNTYTWIKQIR